MIRRFVLGHELEVERIKAAERLYMNAVSGKRFPVVVSGTSQSKSDLVRNLPSEVTIYYSYLADLRGPENRKAHALL
jgi:L-asparaginase II